MNVPLFHLTSLASGASQAEVPEGRCDSSPGQSRRGGRRPGSRRKDKALLFFSVCFPGRGARENKLRKRGKCSHGPATRGGGLGGLAPGYYLAAPPGLRTDQLRPGNHPSGGKRVCSKIVNAAQLFGFFWLVAFPAFAQVSQAWVARYNGGFTNGTNHERRVTHSMVRLIVENGLDGLHPWCMPRTLRVENSGAVYHLMSRGDQRDGI